MFSSVKRLLVVADDLPAAVWAELQQALPEAEITCLRFDQVQLPTGFEAAIVLTAPGQSPYAAAYRCYLAGIPIRVGQSIEFGGGVLSQCVQPPAEATDSTQYHLHLLRSIELVNPTLAN